MRISSYCPAVWHSASGNAAFMPLHAHPSCTSHPLPRILPVPRPPPLADAMGCRGGDVWRGIAVRWVAGWLGGLPHSPSLSIPTAARWLVPFSWPYQQGHRPSLLCSPLPAVLPLHGPLRTPAFGHVPHLVPRASVPYLPTFPHGPNLRASSSVHCFR